jgi:hypothetical protein
MRAVILERAVPSGAAPACIHEPVTRVTTRPLHAPDLVLVEQQVKPELPAIYCDGARSTRVESAVQATARTP